MSDGKGLVLVTFIITILIFSFLFFWFSFDIGHGISRKMRKELLVLSIETFMVKITLGVVFTNFMKVIHV